MAGVLTDRSVVSDIEEQEIATSGGVKLLNGMFCGVRAGKEMLRSCPFWASGQPICLKRVQILTWSSQNLRCCIYVYALPCRWGEYRAFSRPVNGEYVGNTAGKRYYRCANVVVMGCASSVGIIQPVHRNLMRWAGLPAFRELQRGQPVPLWL